MLTGAAAYIQQTARAGPDILDGRVDPLRGLAVILEAIEGIVKARRLCKHLASSTARDGRAAIVIRKVVTGRAASQTHRCDRRGSTRSAPAPRSAGHTSLIQDSPSDHAGNVPVAQPRLKRVKPSERRSSPAPAPKSSRRQPRSQNQAIAASNIA